MNRLIQGIVGAVRDDLFENLTSMLPQEIIIKEVSDNGTIVAKHTSAPSEVLDTELGSITGGQFGLFYKPQSGTKALAVRVFPGSTNHTQVIKGIFNPAQQNHESMSDPRPDTEQGVMSDGNYEIKSGDILLRSAINQRLFFKSYNGQDGTIELMENNGSGISIETLNSSTFLNCISHYSQYVSSASRSFSGEYHQKIKDESDNIKSNSNMYAVIRPDLNSENKIGLFYPGKAYDAKIMNSPRNVPLTFYKKTINQVTEKAKFIGFENEKQILDLTNNPDSAYDNVELGRFYESRNLYNLFYMAPDQLLQVISGNLLSENNNYNPININYGVTLFDDFKNSRDSYQIKDDNSPAFIRVKNNFNRGISYHFQLNTHSNIKDDFISSKNTRVILDKEGILKVNIPKSSRYGNIMYVDETYFMKDSSNYTPQIINGFAQPSSIEKIPVTLRDNDGQAVLPPSNGDSSALALSVKRLNTTRYSGIEFSNSNGYFGKPEVSGLKVRVNTTKYHNMYAACEMLLANYITAVNPPPLVSSVLSGVATIGMAISETFEKPSSRFKGSLSNPSQKEYQKAYGTVLIDPQDPIINPGGSFVFGGKVYSDIPVYSNSDLEQTESDSSYSGISANINLEGSIETSIGADAADGKSITLDTQGGAVMWFGKDKKGRSLSVQTDGEAMFNIGGHSSDGTWNPGRLDLRVNLTNKGLMGEEEGENGENLETIDSDFIISISEKGIIISGMKNNTPMMINNSGSITLQSKSGIILNGGMGGVKVLEKSRVPKDVGNPSNTANNNAGEPTDAERVAELATEIVDLTNELA